MVELERGELVVRLPPPEFEGRYLEAEDVEREVVEREVVEREVERPGL